MRAERDGALRLHTLAWAVGVLLAFAGVGELRAGDITGTVRFEGEAPPARWLYATADHAVCGREPRAPGALVLSPSGGVANAVVYLAHERLEGWRSPTVFRMDQRRCTFIPRVLIIPPGATVEVLNSDGILHNFHTSSRLNPPLNLAQPAWVKRLPVTFEHPEFVQVKCDLHGEGFMRAWIVVARHPYYALTGKEGQFRLPNLLPGPHTLEVWHELLGRKQVPVTVGAAGEVEMTVTFTKSDALQSP